MMEEKEKIETDSLDGVSDDAVEGPQEPPYPPIGYSWYVVGVLMIFYIFSFVDRQIIALLVEPMKADLGLTDLQVSYIGGLSFAIFYTLFGIPMGRLADSRNRKGIIAIGVALWSLMTTLCGVATHFWHLLILRMGVGVGEATLSPSAFSLITDYFPKHKLGTALSVYSMGIYFGSGAAFTGGAIVLQWAESWVAANPGAALPYLGELRPWQIVFFAIGIPGLILTSLLWTVKEPVRRGIATRKTSAGASKISHVPVNEVLKYLRRNWKTVFCHNVGVAFLSVAAYSGGFWDLAFLGRTYGWSPGQGGLWYGLVTMAAGALGVLFGGRLADYLTRKGYKSASMLAILIAAVVWLPFGALYPLMPSAIWSLVFLFPTLFAGAMPFGCAAAAIQQMMPPQMRGQASAIYLFAINIIGLGIGPTAIAYLTEHVFMDLQMLRYSLFSVGVTAHLLSATILLFSLKPYVKTVEELKTWKIGD